MPWDFNFLLFLRIYQYHLQLHLYKYEVLVIGMFLQVSKSAIEVMFLSRSPVYTNISFFIYVSSKLEITGSALKCWYFLEQGTPNPWLLAMSYLLTSMGDTACGMGMGGRSSYPVVYEGNHLHNEITENDYVCLIYYTPPAQHSPLHILTQTYKRDKNTQIVYA